MTTRNRVLVAAFGVVSMSLAAACSGGGGGGGSGSVPTPASSALSVTTRPLANGQSFTYAGTTTQTFVFSGATPEPQSTTVYTIAQNVTVSGPSTYAGNANVYDVHTAETDTSPLQSIGITTDTFDADVASGSTTDLQTYGFTSSDTSGETLAVVLPTAGLLDELPEKSGQSWSNGAAETVNETSPGGITSARNVNADGSYTDTTTFPTGSIYASPIPGSVLVTSGVITQNPDGSGSYVFNGIVTQGGSPEDVGELDFATPAPAASGMPASIAISVPQSGATPVVTTIPVWYPQPLKLYSETDTDTGAVAIPGACGVPASLGTTANAIVTSIVRYETIVGTQENFTQTDYVVPTYGLACVTLNEKLQYFYDYSGQTDLQNLVPNANVSATATYPIETETIASTIGLAQATVDSTSRAGARAVSFARVTNARANFIALVDKEKLRQRTALAQKFRRALLERTSR